MPPAEFQALVRASRWSALEPFLDPDGVGPLDRLPISAPFHSAIQVDDYQLVPLLKALRMPRISMLLADDVGLGKTIEAGLILSELLIRRRIRRVLILSPAALRLQWQQEMRDKFCLPFGVVDRERTFQLRKELGLDANPWRTAHRLITSYHYLKQADVLEEFRSACRVPEGTPQLPWDLLIVDEAHNLAPAPFGEDSDLCQMLGLIAPYFEHKLFLTATPHNGHTRCFTGLLEMLDPVRFTRTSEIGTAERKRIEEVVVRRLKTEINASTNPPRFSERRLEGLALNTEDSEKALSRAFQAFRAQVRALIRKSPREDQLAGAFAVEVLGKRLLSCPVTFADTWHRLQQGAAGAERASAADVRAAERTAREESADDRETEARTRHAAETIGAWLQPMLPNAKAEIEAVDQALQGLGLEQTGIEPAKRAPLHDARLEAVWQWIDRNLCQNGTWRDDERLIVFTEYMTTLDYLKARLAERFGGDEAILCLVGGMDDEERDVIKRAFNDPAAAVRILIATDAASEGLNLQETARLVLHYDIPWNPARLEQRNGRLDRHGQARDVSVLHFTSTDDADLRFVARVVEKVHTIRQDLGSTGEVFESAFQRHFVDGASAKEVDEALDLGLKQAAGRAEVPRDAAVDTKTETGEAASERLCALAAELDLDPTSLRDTLELAMSVGVGLPRLEKSGDSGRLRFVPPIPPAWTELVETQVCLQEKGGAYPGLVFDPAFFVDTRSGRPVFRPRRDTLLLHLGHPMFHRALSSFARMRFPGAGEGFAVSRWCVSSSAPPPDCDAVILLTVEEIAVNELREPFHHWVRTLQLPVADGKLGSPLAHVPAHDLRGTGEAPQPADITKARGLWEEVERDVRRFVTELAGQRTQLLGAVLKKELPGAVREASERYRSRQGELSTLIQTQTLARLEKDIAELDAEERQGVLFDQDGRLNELRQSKARMEEQLAYMRLHYDNLLGFLEKERERVVNHLLPRRFAMHGEAQVFPVAVEIRLSRATR